MGKENPDFNLDAVAHAALETALQHGHHGPLLMVEGDLNTAVCPILELGDTHPERAQQLFAVGWRLARAGELGALKQVFFITEGWMSMRADGKPLDTPPSQDPQRREVLVIAGLDVTTGVARTVFYEMKRDAAGDLQALDSLSETLGGSEIRAESPLLEAFVWGFTQGTQEAND